MKDNELMFYRNPYTYTLYAAVLGLPLLSTYLTAVKAENRFEQIWLSTFGILLIGYIGYFIFQIIKSFQNIPAIILTKESLIENKIGLVINWVDIVDISKEGYRNTYIQIQLREPYSNFQTIQNPINKLYFKIKHKLGIKFTNLYLVYITGNDDEIVTQIKDYWNNLQNV